ncbi:hypothetical protein HL666_05710 [Bradyrhizobium sp. 83002]|uniref:hypothetical protein n=1 Tax=Bradyrhizobium aeschynomenes TaxID=2734909 RepID=UPI0015573A52|nr:hypothetical protein [Bradyrhizobium aeschynomenes]NPU10244.1 hypothetical protein [Bradyrhizobium aeschynomenes]
MLKSMSVALLAASILAAPAFAAGPVKTDTPAKPNQITGSTTGTGKADATKTDATKSDATKPGGMQSGNKANEMKPADGKGKGKPHASLLRHTHRHTAHLRHHDKVKVSHAISHKKVSFKRVTPATRRG